LFPTLVQTGRRGLSRAISIASRNRRRVGMPGRVSAASQIPHLLVQHVPGSLGECVLAIELPGVVQVSPKDRDGVAFFLFSCGGVAQFAVAAERSIGIGHVGCAVAIAGQRFCVPPNAATVGSWKPQAWLCACASGISQTMVRFETWFPSAMS
jgi:hypothetical protein